MPVINPLNLKKLQPKVNTYAGVVSLTKSYRLQNGVKVNAETWPGGGGPDPDPDPDPTANKYGGPLWTFKEVEKVYRPRRPAKVNGAYVNSKYSAGADATIALGNKCRLAGFKELDENCQRFINNMNAAASPALVRNEYFPTSPVMVTVDNKKRITDSQEARAGASTEYYASGGAANQTNPSERANREAGAALWQAILNDRGASAQTELIGCIKKFVLAWCVRENQEWDDTFKWYIQPLPKTAGIGEAYGRFPWNHAIMIAIQMHDLLRRHYPNILSAEEEIFVTNRFKGWCRYGISAVHVRATKVAKTRYSNIPYNGTTTWENTAQFVDRPVGQYVDNQWGNMYANSATTYWRQIHTDDKSCSGQRHFSNKEASWALCILTGGIVYNEPFYIKAAIKIAEEFLVYGTSENNHPYEYARGIENNTTAVDRNGWNYVMTTLSMIYQMDDMLRRIGIHTLNQFSSTHGIVATTAENIQIDSRSNPGKTKTLANIFTQNIDYRLRRDEPAFKVYTDYPSNGSRIGVLGWQVDSWDPDAGAGGVPGQGQHINQSQAGAVWAHAMYYKDQNRSDKNFMVTKNFGMFDPDWTNVFKLQNGPGSYDISNGAFGTFYLNYVCYNERYTPWNPETNPDPQPSVSNPITGVPTIVL